VPASVDVLLHDENRTQALRADARAGLVATPKALPPKWLYDGRGSDLFERITELPEYYLTRAERSILEARAPEIAARTRAETLVELGSGSSRKTRLLLDALAAAGTLRRFVAFDVSEPALRDSTARLAEEYPELEIQGVVGDFERQLDTLPQWPRMLVVLLGSSIGNFPPDQRARFLQTIRTLLAQGDFFLVGLDLVKDVARLEAAYADPGGVSAAFSTNLLAVLNRELGADFDVDAFEHVARWDGVNEWMQMTLRARRPQRVSVPALGLEVAFAEGEELQTQISAKFRRARFREELARAGLVEAGWWTDDGGDFALCLAAPA
jgi:L-histidine N-alpha-methyltransferase